MKTNYKSNFNDDNYNYLGADLDKDKKERELRMRDIFIMSNPKYANVAIKKENEIIKKEKTEIKTPSKINIKEAVSKPSKPKKEEIKDNELNNKHINAENFLVDRALKIKHRQTKRTFKT
jgi:hypothetical protein